MNDEISESLIKQLKEMSQNHLLPLERRLADTAVWFHENKDRIPRENLAARVDFLFKSVDIFIELLAMTAKRMQEVEGRPKSSSLFIPRGVDVKGDVRHFG